MSSTDETEILQRLRDSPQLFTDLARCTGSELAVQRQLRATWDADLVRAALALNAVRGKTDRRLPQASELWLTNVGLEQSTAWEVAQHKAARFPAGEDLLDLCCGIGVDTAALLGRGPVSGVDNDPGMSLRCEWNVELWKTHGDISSKWPFHPVVADVHGMNLDGTWLHIDPDRRNGRERPARRLEQYCPGLEWMQRITKSAKGGALKLGPASNFMQKFPGCETELISLHGECREATIWFGEAAGAHSFRATSLPSGESIAADPLSAWCPQADEVQEFVFDPDPAVVRSGLLDVVADLHKLQRLDQDDEYLTGSRIPYSAFVTAYAVEACLPNSLRDLKRYLRQHPGRDYEIKCRHLKVDANALQKKLPRGDGPIRTLIHLRIGGKARVVVATRTKKTQNSRGSYVDD